MIVQCFLLASPEVQDDILPFLKSADMAFRLILSTGVNPNTTVLQTTLLNYWIVTINTTSINSCMGALFCV